jgi:serine/threonine protein kinase
MDLRAELQSLLGGLFNFERELAGAGMSRVFVAEEIRLRRKVAVKVLPPEIAGEISVERFAREIQLLARLQHPHIVPILTAGEANGILYYAMPMIEGESLRDRLERDGSVDLTEAVRIVAQVAEALAFAHAEGVLHRDIKPENILVSHGYALVLDFGIAKAIDASKAASSTRLTADGMSLGTPLYMSPEQAFADPTIDLRSDVYSLAVVLFELLAGTPPFSGSNVAATLAKRLTGVPVSVSRLTPSIPPYIDAAIARAMSLDPDDRFASASEFAAAIQESADAGGRRPNANQARGRQPERSIAVLPFVTASGDIETEYFGDGMTEEIINAIAHLPGLRVAARTSSLSLKGKDISIAQIGKELNVATVLEGSVRRAGGRIRITARLISVVGGYQLWSERYDRSFEDVFAIQDDIARAIVEKLRVALARSDDRTLVRPGTDNVEAYDLYLRGRHLWSRRGPGLATAVEYFTRAVVADPQFAAPHAGLSDCYLLMAVNGYVSASQVFARAQAAAYRALALDPHSAESQAAVGLFELWMGWDFAIAERMLRQASEANPAWAVPFCWLGQLAAYKGNFEQANIAARHASRAEPLSPVTSYIAAMIYIWTGSFNDAELAARRGIELDPSFPMGYLALGLIHYHNGQLADALMAIDRSVELSGRSSLILGSLGNLLVTIGRRPEAEAILAELESRNVDAWSSGQLHWALGQEDTAFQYFERAARERHPCFFATARAPGLERLIADSRWGALLRRHTLDEVASAFEGLVSETHHSRSLNAKDLTA